jgi:phospholipase/lecithinase/hemolysin
MAMRIISVNIEVGKAKHWKVMAVFILLLLAPETAGAQTEFDRIVVFGTSLSDSGNRFSITKEVNTPPNYAVDLFLVPDAAYPRGGHRLSNGPTWVEQLAKPLGMKKFVLPALRDNNPNSSNYATDGTRSAVPFEDKLVFSDQVDFFLDDSGGSAPSSALYVVEMGSNDIKDAFVAFLEAPTMNPPQDPFQTAEAVIESALNAILDNIVTLHTAGAIDFLILNAPPIGFTPAVRSLDQVLAAQEPSIEEGDIMDLANLITMEFNAGLSDVLDFLKLTLPSINSMQLDVFSTTIGILENPESFGLTEVEEACIEPQSPNFVCDNPDEYFFWDGTHPTETVHAIFAAEAVSELEP